MMYNADLQWHQKMRVWLFINRKKLIEKKFNMKNRLSWPSFFAKISKLTNQCASDGGTGNLSLVPVMQTTCISVVR